MISELELRVVLGREGICTGSWVVPGILVLAWLGGGAFGTGLGTGVGIGVERWRDGSLVMLSSAATLPPECSSHLPLRLLSV